MSNSNTNHLGKFIEQNQEVSEMRLSVGGDLLLEKHKRSIGYLKRKERRNNICFQFCGGLAHRIIQQTLLSRPTKILLHILFGIGNFFTFGVLGMILFCIIRCNNNDKGDGSINSYYQRIEDEHNEVLEDAVKRKSIFSKKKKQSKRKKHKSRSITQVELLKNKFNLTASDIQHKLISWNTKFFVEIPRKEYSKEEKEEIEIGIKNWNNLISTLLQFTKEFQKGFRVCMDMDKRIRKLYRGEYENLFEDMKEMQEIDVDSQSMMYYATNIKLSKHKFIYGRGWSNRIKQLQEKLRSIKERVDLIETEGFVPANYFSQLPSDAKKIMDYNKAFVIWKNTNYDIKEFLKKYKVEFDGNGLPKKNENFVELRTQLEKVIFLWREKKGKTEKSKKLRIADEILSKMKELSPSTLTKLSILKRSSLFDVANMMRTFYNELLIGRILLIQKYDKMDVKEEIFTI